jgi:hypothetical protein
LLNAAEFVFAAAPQRHDESEAQERTIVIELLDVRPFYLTLGFPFCDSWTLCLHTFP